MFNDLLGGHFNSFIGQNFIDLLLYFGIFLNFNWMANFLHKCFESGNFLFAWESMSTQESLAPVMFDENLSYFLIG